MSQQVILATRTIIALENMVHHDQGNAFRKWQKYVIPNLEDAYQHTDTGFRNHMGASGIGNKCARAIWYGFRWTTDTKHSGRMIRLFNRGHLEEGRFIALLLALGCRFYQQDSNGKQFRISDSEGHFGGSGDGICFGLPEFEIDLGVLTEFKTHNEKSFNKLAGANWAKFVDHLLNPATTIPEQFEGEGVKEAKFEHYVQMQVYMYKMGLPCAVYFAVNKNNDSIYAEIVVLDKVFAEQYIQRADKLVFAEIPPKKLHNSASFFECRFCDHKAVCHVRMPPAKNCRTCQYSSPVADKQWFCSFHNCTLDKEIQLTGCTTYTINDAIYR